MPTPTPGIHHITAVGRDPQSTHEFYSETLGLRLVKRSVNQDDVSVYHLFYADREGTPGTSFTVFPYPNARAGEPGVGQATAVQFLIPEAAVSFWQERLESAGVLTEEPLDRFGDTVLQCRAPDGLPIEFVGQTGVQAGTPPTAPLAAENAIRGFYGTTLSVSSVESTGKLLETIGYERVGSNGNRIRYESRGQLGSVVDVREMPDAPSGQPGAGTVHHVAYRVDEDQQEAWRNLLIDHGLRPTQIIDRTWFKSVYVRTKSGILFEFASEKPGYTVDEPLDALGERLVLPGELEKRRTEIEQSLPKLE